MVELPSTKAHPWRVRDWVLELASAGLAFVLAGLALLRPGLARWQVGVGLAAVAGVLVISGRKAWRTRQAELEREPARVPDELAGAIRGMHVHLCKVRGCAANDLGVRIVIYKVHWDRQHTAPTELEQVTHYHGDLGGKIGRRLSARSGIVGRVARLAQPAIAKRLATDVTAYRAELVNLWGFTQPEARQINADRWAWMAVPLIQDDGHVFGVVYLDTDRPNLFDNFGVFEAVTADCALLATICSSIYSSQ